MDLTTINESEKPIIEKMVNLGWTEFESKVFLTLYKGFRMPAEEIAKAANINRTAVYPVLKNLVKKGYCLEIQCPGRFEYELIDKDVLQDKIIIDNEQQFKTNLHLIKGLFENISPLYKTYPIVSEIPKIEVIKGYNRHRNYRFNKLLKNTKRSVLFMNRFKGILSSDTNKIAVKKIKEGVELRSIYEIGIKIKDIDNINSKGYSSENLIEICKEFEKQGEQIRFLNRVPQMMEIYDGEKVLLNFWGEKIPAFHMIDLLIYDKNFAMLMTETFNNYWKKAMTINEYEKNYKRENLIIK